MIIHLEMTLYCCFQEKIILMTTYFYDEPSSVLLLSDMNYCQGFNTLTLISFLLIILPF